MTKHPKPQPGPVDTANSPVGTDAVSDAILPNRRERRGGRSKTVSRWGGQDTAVRSHSTIPSPRQYSTRRRGG